MKTHKTYRGTIHSLTSNQIFVFGSNTQGRHGKGAALYAKLRFGAIYGQAEGLQGQSFAIITKDLTKKNHPSRTFKQITEQIEMLYKFAKISPDKEFFIIYKGEGENLNSYSPKDLAKMFAHFEIPDNIVFEEGFYTLIKQHMMSSLAI